MAVAAKAAGLYSGAMKKITPTQKSKLTRIFNLVPNIASPYSTFKSVIVPKEYREEYARRGFKVFGERVIVNSPNASRIRFNKRSAEIRTSGTVENVRVTRSFSLDLDFERAVSRADERDAMLSLSQGGQGGKFDAFDRASLNQYLSELYAKQNGKYTTPALTYVTKTPLGDEPMTVKSYRVKNWNTSAKKTKKAKKRA